LSADTLPSENAFLQFEVEVSAPFREVLLEILWELETLGCEETEEPDRVRLTAFFPASDDPDRIRQQILSRSREGGWEPVHVSQRQIQFAPREWLERYSENFKAFSVGNTFFIHPSWVSPSRDYPVNLLIEPGHGFGTGTHESTQLCLLALESTAPEVSTLLDVGTGSGILTIAAQKLNPRLNVLAFDIDPLAIDAARENFFKNRISRPKLWVGDIGAVAGQVDLVVANLTAAIIQRLASEIARLAREYVIVSGFTVEQAPLVLESLEKHYELLQAFSRNDWLCYKLRAWQES
jgi:ribosomal protein L11 methyltransferase